MRRFDRYAPWLAAAACAAVCVSLGLIHFDAPVDQTMGIVQKIFYSHVPAAMAAYAGFTIASVASLLYLLKPSKLWDVAAMSGAEVGLLFCVYVLVSGPLWAVKAWGQAWVWDPQLTATFVLFLLYGAYVMLRVFSEESEGMRKIAASLAVLAFVDIPIIHYAVQQWGGMHPIVEREGGGGLAPAMKTAFSTSMFAFLLVFALLFWLSFRSRYLEEQIETLYIDLEDLRRRFPEDL
jgi:heme exporter protein C